MPGKIDQLLHEIDARLPDGLCVGFMQHNDDCTVFLGKGDNISKDVALFKGSKRDAVSYLEGFHACAFIEGMWQKKIQEP